MPSPRIIRPNSGAEVAMVMAARRQARAAQAEEHGAQERRELIWAIQKEAAARVLAEEQRDRARRFGRGVPCPCWRDDGHCYTDERHVGRCYREEALADEPPKGD